ncbi:clasp N terminal-domain-containing protein [Schizophyllum amplum]|uniref:Clasp N terminal-domain-containing protein n=1 Tax=Schizophyllum amplum TaxID=97359 RepID=A0A550CU96_9AGAR|nr:clasp N terminal-domain-containing protein [Auriculariopsis ampla]
MEQDGSQLEKLLTQCRSNDVDVKVDALNKLQAAFEAGTEIDDPDGLITVLKTCLRTSNLHLTTAAAATIPPLLPLLFSRPVTYIVPPARPQSASSSSSSVASGLLDVVLLRQTLNAFLPTGGLIERLGDKERVQVKAREALVLLGGYAFRASGTSTLSTRSRDGRGVETPLMIFERFLREAGLGSKVWKVREQSILTLVHIRRSHHQFPLRPFLPLLVGALEDTDAHVRDCARVSVVELFTGPATTDTARADLKKELAKKGVRKTIADSVIAQVLSGGASAAQIPDPSEGGETSKPKEYIPPSLALQSRKPSSTTTTAPISRTTSASTIPRPASRSAVASPPLQPSTSNENSDIRPVYIASTRDLENEFAQSAAFFEGKESEHNWAARERLIVRVRGMIKGDVHLKFTDALLACFKDNFIQWSTKTLASLRTTVAVHTCQLYTELAVAMGSLMDPFAEVILTHLLGMSGFTKRIASQQSQASVTAIITHTTPPPRVIIPLLWHTMQEKNVQSRTYAVAHIKYYVEVHGQLYKAAIESHGYVDTLEKAVQRSVVDANPSVREKARIAFWSFESVWPERSGVILDALDNTARKQLEKACPDPSRVETLAIAAPQPKKSSVAAAIAASRAKARAIANAPPSLRHQATSTSSHTTPARRAGSPSTSPRSSTNRPSSPLSPPSTRSRIVSNGVPRPPVSTNTSHSRSPPSGRASPSSPPMLRQASSPLASPTSGDHSVFRAAVNTALPASPPPAGRTESRSPPRRMPNGTTRSSAVPLPRPSISELFASDDQSLLLASGVPIPEDSDSDDSVNLMTFSSPFEKRATPRAPKSNSQAHSFSPESSTSMLSTPIKNTLSSDSIAGLLGKPVVEDVLSANAEQAMSAAERLLELNDSEDGLDMSPIPSALLKGKTNGNGAATPKAQKQPPTPLSFHPPKAPVTPMNRNTMIMRQAAMFKDSPANGARSASLMDVLQDRRQETGWWLKRKALMAQGTPLRTADAHLFGELERYVSQLESDEWDARTLQKLALICKERPAAASSSPPLSPHLEAATNPFAPPGANNTDLWQHGRTFDRLLNTLLKALTPERTEEELEYGLIVLWEILENQWSLLEGREGDIFSALFQMRYSNKVDVLEATNSLRDALCARVGPVYGITTLHASLRVFHDEKPPPTADEEIKAQTYAFGLMALGKFILRVPSEIAEEELPRLKSTLITGLNDKSSLVVRESAAAVIIAAQMVMRDEAHLFALLDGLADEKKNLLTYLFDKHGARGAGVKGGGMDKLEKEMRRLDTRTSTPPRRA